MQEGATIAQLFALAIEVERAAERLYRGLEAKFASHPEIAGFWRQYADEEAGHALWLERLRDKLAPERLSVPAAPAMLESARVLLQWLIKNPVKEVKNLEDAYQLANELEHSEINVIFEFLITNFSVDRDTPSFLRAQLRKHLAKLMTEFPQQFGNNIMRSAIQATS